MHHRAHPHSIWLRTTALLLAFRCRWRRCRARSAVGVGLRPRAFAGVPNARGLTPTPRNCINFRENGSRTRGYCMPGLHSRMPMTSDLQHCIFHHAVPSSFFFQQVGDSRYTSEGARVTHFEFNPHGRVALYRIFDKDPMLLPSGKGQLWTWRNGETLDVETGLKCVNMTGPQIGDSLHNATVTTHTWTYEVSAAMR